MSKIQKKAAKAALGCLLLLLLYGCANEPEPPVLDTSEQVSDGQQPDEDSGTEGKLYVYVCGEVKHPGVYELEAGSRVFQAIDQAGGFTRQAAESVNLADYVTDGQMIRVASIQETDDSGDLQDPRVNINTADEDTLMTLPGIGESKAKAIVAYREDQGAFASAEEILNVSGIGNGVYDKIKDSIRIN